MSPYPSPRLLADIGGSHVRYALETGPGRFQHTAAVRCAAHADFLSAVTAYLAGLPADLAARIEHGAVAMANPVAGDGVRMTRGHWAFSSEDLRQRLGLTTLVVVNDYTALAMALPRLSPAQRRQVGGGTARVRSVVGLLGAGSGLGVSGLVPVGGGADGADRTGRADRTGSASGAGGAGLVALGTEGGHASFAPRDEREIAILRHAQSRYPQVSFEHLLSGPGLELIHDALRAHAGLPSQALAAPDITQAALAGSNPLCVQALQVYCAVLGTAAANLALTLGALGGIYIAGAIVPRLGDAFDRSPFRARFEDQGRSSAYLQGIPTWVVTAEHATFIGLSAILAAQLQVRQVDQDTALLSQIQRSREGLSPAERRVAEHVLAHPRSALSDPIAEIAKAAQVSQPTVIRFCRSLGCQGLSDFKLRLASGLSGAIPLSHAQVTDSDSPLELGVKVLGNTASAVLQLREQLNRDALARAIEMLAAAQRIELFAVGPDAVVTDDARFKFLRFGLPSASHTDSHLQALAAQVMRASDVAVIVSSSGRSADLLAVAGLAQARGAAVVAVTASQSPLARQADVALIVDHLEDAATQVAMVSRILHLLVIDILAVGVAMKLGQPAADAVPALPARLTSHSR